MEEERFNLFCQLTKIDEKTRRVYGRATQEIPDGTREIMDYESSKPNFEKWSGDAQLRTAFLEKGERSYGNVREMHRNIASGKIIEPLSFKDDERAIDVATECVDEDTWNKILKGVLTGFSIGGKYGKRWPDPNNPSCKRYTAIPQEISYVDTPAVSTATFTFIKIDGSEELRKVGDISLVDETVLTDTVILPIESPTDVPDPIGSVEIRPVEAIVVTVPERPEEQVEVTKSTIDPVTAQAFSTAVAMLVALKKSVDDEAIAKLNKLKTTGSTVGIARREDEPLIPTGSQRSDDYADPANWSWEYGSTDLCAKVLEGFNAGQNLEKYLDRERHVLGRRVATQMSKLSGVQYKYDLLARQIRKDVDMNKDGLGPLITQLAGAFGIAADQVSNDPTGALAEIVSHLSSAMQGATTAPSSSPSGISTIPSTSTSTSTTPTSTTPSEVEKAVDQESTTPTTTSDMGKLQAEVSELKSLVKALLDRQTPTQPKQNLPALGLGGQSPREPESPLEKAMSAAASHWTEGTTAEQIQPIVEAAGGDFSFAQNKALDLVKKSLAARGFTASNKIRTLDPATIAAIRKITPVRS